MALREKTRQVRGKSAREQLKAAKRRALRQKRLWQLNLVICLVLFFILSVWWIGIDLGFFAKVSPQTEQMMETVDLIAIGVFLLELYSRFSKSDDKAKFLRANWMELIVLLPIGLAFRALKSVESLGSVRVIRPLFEIKEIQAVVPGVAIFGEATARIAIEVKKWLTHYSVITDFFDFAVKSAKKLFK
ncbi:MAG: hypothetical protein NT051_01890 [Candidatus Micrarchaeota archaeon]|nr:hypothetical protein [Candidatus Micrarchaeota archaeon]